MKVKSDLCQCCHKNTIYKNHKYCIECLNILKTTRYCKCGCGQIIKSPNPSCLFIRGHSNRNQEIKKKKIDNYKKTMLEKYGCENSFQVEEFKDKIKKTNLERYGYEYSTMNHNIQEKYKKTCLDKYGCDNVSKFKEIKEKKKNTYIKHYGVDSPLKCEIIKQKYKQTCLKKYGITNAAQLESSKERMKKTMLKKYGVEYAIQSTYLRNKMCNTNLEIYGVRYPSQCILIKNKVIQTNRRKYNCDHYTQTQEYKDRLPEISKNSSCKYTYKDIKFDSIPELSIYIYLTDNNIKFEYHPNIKFEYIFDNKKHVYIPDFLVENEYWEIKGDQFFDNNGNMINPFDKSENELCSCKYKCMLENHVKILRYKDYKIYLNYIEEKYGKKYLEQFKNIHTKKGL